MRGRGLEDSTYRPTMCLNTVTDCARISTELFGTKRSAEQHIEMKRPRMKQDVDVLLKLLACFKKNTPFRFSDQECLVISPSSGVCARDGVMCNIANELGMHILRK